MVVKDEWLDKIEQMTGICISELKSTLEECQLEITCSIRIEIPRMDIEEHFDNFKSVYIYILTELQKTIILSEDDSARKINGLEISAIDAANTVNGIRDTFYDATPSADLTKQTEWQRYILLRWLKIANTILDFKEVYLLSKEADIRKLAVLKMIEIVSK